MMGLASAVSTCSARAVPEIAGSPVAGWFAGRLRYSVRVATGSDQSRLAVVQPKVSVSIGLKEAAVLKS